MGRFVENRDRNQHIAAINAYRRDRGLCGALSRQRGFVD
jgi:hypothetical protein